MTLYEINTELESLVDEETGELLDYDRFVELNLERDAKIENMVLWVKDLEAEAAAISGEMVALAERRDRARKKAERLKGYLTTMLDGERFQTARCAVSYRKSVSVDIADASKFVAYAQREGLDGLLTYEEPKPSKSAVKDYLKRGNTLDGACLVERTNIQIK